MTEKPETEAPETSEKQDAAAAPTEDAKPKKEKKEESLLSFSLFLVKLAVIVLIFRSVVAAPFSIPSESMVPRLLEGDHLIASKWSYGVSNNSLPFGWAPFPDGRLFASQPERGDVVIFKHPISGEDYIKRTIGLPGDTIQMQAGVLLINGNPVPKERVSDLVVEISPYMQCGSGTSELETDGTLVCRLERYRETLPNGATYNVLDDGMSAGDNTQEFTVPEGQLFVMGDNRDHSLDSRWAASVDRNGGGQAVGIIDQDLLVGKAQFMMWSTDGGAEWYLPWTWFTNTRWNRIGGGI